VAQDQEFKVQNIFQIGMVVKDIDEKAKFFWDNLGIGPWYFVEFGPNAGTKTYYGEPASFELKIALAQVGPVQLELIQPVSGMSPHMDFINAELEGLHHLGVLVDDIGQVDYFKKLGYETASEAYGLGDKKDGFGAYIDMRQDCGILLELIRFPEGESCFYKIYPESSGQ